MCQIRLAPLQEEDEEKERGYWRRRRRRRRRKRKKEEKPHLEPTINISAMVAEKLTLL